jgi:NAD(P) transhydrogenase subunit alpha
MKVGVPKEVHAGECRVAATPDTAKRLQKLGFAVVVESGAGALASFSDDAYREAGCEIAAGPGDVWACDIVAKVREPEEHPGVGAHEATFLKEGSTLISFIWPAQNEQLVQRLSNAKANVIAMDAVPRITRAQKLDALSSMANIAGYRAVIEAAQHFGRFFTGQITAAGKVPPAKVMIIGAGVAGLAAIGAARGLGAIVRAFDTRPAVKEQVESMGAEFLELDFEEDGAGAGGYAKVMSKEFIDAEMALFLEQAKEVDIIITTALIPGKPAPLLITKEHVEAMRAGSVIVDLAAERGGNCEVSRPNEVVEHAGVKVIGYTDLPSRLAAQASQLYGTNIYHLLDDLGGAKEFGLDLDDEVVRGATIIKEGKVIWPPPKKDPPPTPEKKPEPAAGPPRARKKHEEKKQGNPLGLAGAGLILLAIGLGAPDPGQGTFLSHFTVFVLAIFIGWQVIWNVTAALHTPLMSVTNAISGIIIVGGMLQVSGSPSSATVILGAIAILVATINIAGGFLVTQRMLQMFRK